MKHRLRIVPEVVHDARDIQEFYARIDAHLGAAFRAELRDVLRRLADHPAAHAAVYRDVRHVLLRRFPYAIYYRIKDSVVRVQLISHTARDPVEVRKRLRADAE